MVRKTKNNRTRKQKAKNFETVQHHHFLLRMETQSCPGPDDKEKAEHMIHMIINDIHMQLLDKPHVYYMKLPLFNEGLTAIAPIQTSHIAFHFWVRPDRQILHHKESKCLLEFDIYTCGNMSMQQIHKVLHHLSVFKPTHVDATLLNRKWSLTIDKHIKWDLSQGPWTQWLESYQFA
jgi:S-adenosylmethionine/arginine decarboxylase-like enzyme